MKTKTFPNCHKSRFAIHTVFEQSCMFLLVFEHLKVLSQSAFWQEKRKVEKNTSNCCSKAGFSTFVCPKTEPQRAPKSLKIDLGTTMAPPWHQHGPKALSGTDLGTPFWSISSTFGLQFRPYSEEFRTSLVATDQVRWSTGPACPEILQVLPFADQLVTRGAGGRGRSP